MFDLLYGSFGAAIVVLLLVTVGLGLSRSDRAPVVVASGYAVILIAGIGFTELVRSDRIGDVAALQAKFLAFYAGFALILLGSELMLRAHPSRAIRWSAYGLACAIAGVYLFTPDLAAYARAGETTRVSQQVVFYLPLYVGLVLVAVESWRGPNRSLAAFALLLLVGIIRESGAIPSFGDAYLDLLGAFVPFALAALVLTHAAWSRRTSPTGSRRSADA
jgi:hypothetical protein